MTNDKRLEEIKLRAEKATPGDPKSGYQFVIHAKLYFKTSEAKCAGKLIAIN